MGAALNNLSAVCLTVLTLLPWTAPFSLCDPQFQPARHSAHQNADRSDVSAAFQAASASPVPVVQRAGEARRLRLLASTPYISRAVGEACLSRVFVNALALPGRPAASRVVLRI